MRNPRSVRPVAVLVFLALAAPWAHAAALGVGETVICSLSAEEPTLAYEFTPLVGGTLRVDLEPLGVSWVHLSVFRGAANTERQPVAAGRLEGEAGLSLSLPAAEGVPHRILLALDEASEEAACQLTLRGLNMRGSVLLVRDAMETRLLAVASGQELASWVPPATQSETVTFSPRGDQVLTQQGASLSLAGTFTGQTLGTATLPPGGEAEFQFVPDLPRLLPASVTGTNALSLLSTPDLAEVATFTGTHTLLSPKADRFIVYGASTALVADTLTGSVVAQWQGTTTESQALLSPDGRTVAFWEAGPGASQSGRLYETSSGQPLGEPHPFASLDRVLFSPDGSRVLWLGSSLSKDERLALLQSTAEGALVEEEGLSLFTRSEPLDAYFGPLSRRLILAPSGEPSIAWMSLYDCGTGTLLRSYIGFGPVYLVRFHPYGKTVFVLGPGPDAEALEARFINADEGSQLQQYSPWTFQYGDYDSTGRRFALVGEWRAQNAQWEEVQIIDGLQGNKIGSANADNWLDPLFSPDGERLVAHSLGRSWPDPISQAVVWETAGGSEVDSSLSMGALQAKGISADSSRYYYLSQLSSGLQNLLVMNLTTGRQVGGSVTLRNAADPVLNFSGSDLFYVGQGEGDSVGHIGKVHLANGQAQRGASIAYATPGWLRWSGDGKRLLFAYNISEGGQRRVALIDAGLLTVLGDYPAERGAKFDSTVRPKFLTFDFTGEGDVNAWDLFELQLRLDPDYPEVLHEFIQASDWR